MNIKNIMLIGMISLITIADSSFAMNRRSPSPDRRPSGSAGGQPPRRRERSPSPNQGRPVEQGRPQQRTNFPSRPQQRSESPVNRRSPSPRNYGNQYLSPAELAASGRPIFQARRPQPPVVQVVHVVQRPVVNFTAYVNAFVRPSMTVSLHQLPLIHQILLGLAGYRIGIFNSYSRTDIDTRDHEGKTAVHRAVLLNGLNANDRFELVRDLHLGGANLNAQDNDGITALHLAVAQHDARLVTFLVSRMARLIPDNSGRTPLDWAAQLNYHIFYPEIILALLGR